MKNFELILEKLEDDICELAHVLIQRGSFMIYEPE